MASKDPSSRLKGTLVEKGDNAGVPDAGVEPRLRGTLVGADAAPAPAETRLRGALVEPRTAAATGSVALGGDSRLRGKLVSKEAAGSSSELPTFTELRPEPNKVKIYKAGNVDLRLSSTSSHQDGIAHNPDKKTVALSDGMGGVGRPGDVKNNFAFALSHAVAELDDVLTLQDPEVVKGVVARSRSLLGDMGIDVEAPPTTMKGGVGAGKVAAWAATLAAVQEKPGAIGSYRMAIFGDNSVVKLGEDGRIKEGYGEAFQLITRGEVNPDGSAKEQALGSFVGISKDSAEGEGIAQYGNDGLKAVFGEATLEPGESLVIVSDAYMQKTGPHILEADAALTAEAWAAKAPVYGDDTTMGIITRPR